MAELADAEDSKSSEVHPSCGFDSRLGHSPDLDLPVLNTSVIDTAPHKLSTPFLAVIVPQQGTLPASLVPLDQSSGGALTRAYAAGDVIGKKDEAVLLYPTGSATRILLVGIGKPGDLRRQLRRAASIASKRARLAGAPKGALFATPEAIGGLGTFAVAQVLAEGVGYGAWHYADLKQPPEDPKPKLESFELLGLPHPKEAVEGFKELYLLERLFQKRGESGLEGGLVLLSVVVCGHENQFDRL